MTHGIEVCACGAQLSRCRCPAHNNVYKSGKKCKACTEKAKTPLPVVEQSDDKLDFSYTCQRCTKRYKSTHSRELYLKDYQGPCADSFCYASCDSSMCRPQRLTVCDACTKEISK